MISPVESHTGSAGRTVRAVATLSPAFACGALRLASVPARGERPQACGHARAFSSPGKGLKVHAPTLTGDRMKLQMMKIQAEAVGYGRVS